MRDFVFTSTSVLPGHPDKLCDRISDALVDAHLDADPETTILAECAIASDVVFLICHSSASNAVDHAAVARSVLQEVGYRPPALDPERIAIMLSLGTLDSLPPTEEDQLPASHNVTVFGYACRQTPDLMPAPIHLAHRLARRLWEESDGDPEGLLGPDGQVQVSLEYVDRRPVRLAALTVLVGDRAAPETAQAAIREKLMALMENLDTVPADRASTIHFNPEGAFTAGGPRRHPGLTGRKIAVDTYGDFSRQGSSALSGKDPRRIDRIGAYAARYAAKNIVAAGLAEECEVQLSYSAGRCEPVSVSLQTHSTAHMAETQIRDRLTEAMDFRPAAILRRFELDQLPARGNGVFYRNLSAFGQMGERDIDIPWERTDLAAALG